MSQTEPRDAVPYFMLECLSPDEGFLAAVRFRDKRNWNAGERLADPPQDVLEAQLDMKPDSVVPELDDGNLPIMSRRLLTALQRAGVDNLETFPVRLLDSRTGVVLSDDHVAFNIVGVASVMDEEGTRYEGERPWVAGNILSLSVDEARARGLLMFRLAEAVNGIVVHHTLKAAVEAAGIDTLSFIEPSQWAG